MSFPHGEYPLKAVKALFTLSTAEMDEAELRADGGDLFGEVELLEDLQLAQITLQRPIVIASEMIDQSDVGDRDGCSGEIAIS